MSKPKYDWWAYVKGMIRRYPELARQYRELHIPSLTVDYSGMPKGGGECRNLESIAIRELPGTQQREYEAVRRAIEKTGKLATGEITLQIIRLLYWENSMTLSGAALQVHCSYRTARRYHAAFIYRIAKIYGLLDED